MEEYGGWRGAAVVLSGLFLNMCVCGALFRDLEWTASRKRKKRKKDEAAKKSQSRKISGEQVIKYRSKAIGPLEFMFPTMFRGLLDQLASTFNQLQYILTEGNFST